MKTLFKNEIFKRTFFALVLVALIFPSFFIITYGGEPGRIIGAVFFAIIAAIGLFEVFRLLGMRKTASLIMATAPIMFFILPLDEIKIMIDPDKVPHGYSLVNLAKFSFQHWEPWVVLIAYFPIPFLIDDKFRKSGKPMIYALLSMVSIIIVSVFAKTVWVININSVWNVFYFIAIPIISDTFAYFGGMWFGKKWFKGAKFSPKISPKKTWAGFVVGLFCAVTFAIVAGYFMHVWDDFSPEIAYTIIFAIILCVTSPYGDLYFSYMKRMKDKKDYSNLIPGHGGIFDRLDAMAVVLALSGLLLLIH